MNKKHVDKLHHYVQLTIPGTAYFISVINWLTYKRTVYESMGLWMLSDHCNLSTKLDQCILSAVSLLCLSCLASIVLFLCLHCLFEDCTFIAAVWMSDRYDQHKNFVDIILTIVLLIDVFFKLVYRCTYLTLYKPFNSSALPTTQCQF